MNEVLKGRMPDFNGLGEIFHIDKPIDWTSADVVKKVKSLFHIHRVGHAGTLDPKATGLLIVCTGAQTKNVDSFLNLEKEYTGSFQLGVRTPSHDLETDVSEKIDPSGISVTQIEKTMAGFKGSQLQIPPMYSAAKVGGIPLYKYARRGKVIERSAKDVEIKSFRATRIEMPVVEFEVVCSKGTYVRVLVDDLGQKLGCGACLLSLRRTRIGKYLVADAATISELAQVARTFCSGAAPNS